VLSRIIFAPRVTLLVAISAVLLGDTVGFPLGRGEWLPGRRVDLISQRVLDVLMSFPPSFLRCAHGGPGGRAVHGHHRHRGEPGVPLSTRVVRSWCCR